MTRPIGRFDSEASPMQRGGERRRGHQPHRQPDPGAGIAEIERPSGSSRPANADALDMPGAVVPPFDRAPSAAMALAVLITSSASSRPVTLVSPIATAPSIRARCDIDLSPGTRMRPVSPWALREIERLQAL